jgi:hypothetical protein
VQKTYWLVQGHTGDQDESALLVRRLGNTGNDIITFLLEYSIVILRNRSRSRSRREVDAVAKGVDEGIPLMWQRSVESATRLHSNIQ